LFEPFKALGTGLANIAYGVANVAGNIFKMDLDSGNLGFLRFNKAAQQLLSVDWIGNLKQGWDKTVDAFGNFGNYFAEMLRPSPENSSIKHGAFYTAAQQVFQTVFGPLVAVYDYFKETRSRVSVKLKDGRILDFKSLKDITDPEILAQLKDVQAFYVNGILKSLDDTHAMMKNDSKGPAVFRYNPSSGFMADTIETVLDITMGWNKPSVMNV